MTLNRKMVLVDLKRRTAQQQPIPVAWRRRFLGGRGLSAYLFCKHAPAKRRPSIAGDPVVISAGMLAGTLCAPFGHGTVMVRSPGSGLLDRTDFSGPFAARMRQAGFDLLIVTGCAKEPTLLYMEDGKVDFLDAPGFPGNRRSDPDSGIPEAGVGQKPQVLWIQPGKEDENRPAGTSLAMASEGINRVFAAKNIAAIACRGTLDIEVKDPGGMIAYECRIRNRSNGTGTPPAPRNGKMSAIVRGAVGSVSRKNLDAALAQSLGTATDDAWGPDAAVVETAADRIRLATGLQMGVEDLETAAYRCIALERLFNLREGGAGKDAGLSAEDRKSGWTRSRAMKKGKVFERLEIADLWPLFR